MKETGKRKLRKLYNIIFAVFTVAVGLVIISQVWGIFRSAPEKAFSRASVGDRLIAVSPVLIAWIIGLVGSVLINKFTPKPPVLPLKGGLTSAQTLRSFGKRFKKGGEEVSGVPMLRFLRLAVLLTGGVFVVLSTVYGFIYLFDEGYVVKRSAHIFSSHRGAADRLVSATPWFALAILLVFLISIAREYLRVKEIALLKTAFADEMKKKKLGQLDGGSSILYEKGVDKEYRSWTEKVEIFFENKAKAFEIGRLVLRIGLFVSAVILIVLGVNWGGMDLVFEKARSICQQCIGLG